MGLRETVESDIRKILTDTSSCGFGWPVTVKAPDGTTACLTGHSTDVGATIDPDTGQAIAGRSASVSLPLCDLQARSMPMPVAVSDPAKRAWMVRFDDIRGTQHSFKVMDVLPDRAAGVVVLLLEAARWV